MAISFIGEASGITSATLPAHQTGDLILGFSFRDGNNTAPTVPGGWTTIDTTAGSNSNGSGLAYKIAASASETSGTWSSATTVIFLVYRGVDQTNPIGGNAHDGAASTTVNYPTVSMVVSDGTSWVVGFAGHRSTDTSLETPPSGMTNRSTAADATDEGAGHDTNGGVSSWSGTTVSVGGTSSGWRARTVEIRAEVTGSVLTSSGVSTNSFTGSSQATTSTSISGVATVSFTGASQAAAALSSAGSSSVSLTGASMAESVLSSAGVGAGSFTGDSIAGEYAALTSAGAATASFSSAAQSESVVSIAGIASVSFVSAALVESVMSSSGSGTFSATGSVGGGAGPSRLRVYGDCFTYGFKRV